MMRQVKLQILVEKIPVMVHNNVVSTMDGHRLGNYNNGEGRVKSDTVTWEVDSIRKCKKIAVAEMMMKSRDGKIWYSHEHMVQLQMKGKAYDGDCKVSGYSTDVENVYMTDANKNIKLKNYKDLNVRYNAQLQVQINYVDSEILRRLSERYKTSMDPLCQDVQEAKIHQTVRRSGNAFMRNVGDATVTFECSKTMVESVVDEKCFKQLPVKDGSGKRWYLDPQTRILLLKGAETICSPSQIPVLKDMENDYVIHDPQPRQVQMTHIQVIQTSETTRGQKGLYAEEIVDQYLENSYLQDFQESYAVVYEAKSSSGATVFEEAEHLRSTFDMIKDIDVVGLITGLNLQRVGGICSIIVVCCMSVYTVYHVIVFVFKVIIVYGAEDSYYLAAIRALCTSVHLLQEDSNARIRAQNSGDGVKEEVEIERTENSEV